jgi:hypothetical protein
LPMNYLNFGHFEQISSFEWNLFFKQNNLLEQKHKVKYPYHIFFIQLTLHGNNSVSLIL